jgi:hypothetical protein
MPEGPRIVVPDAATATDRPSQIKAPWPHQLFPRCHQLPPCQGVTAANHYGPKAVGAKGGPCFRAPRLGPRPFTISVLKSFGVSFVWVLWLDHLAWSAVAATSTLSDQDSPNASETARSVYVIAHLAARQLWLAPRFWGLRASEPEWQSK